MKDGPDHLRYVRWTINALAREIAAQFESGVSVSRDALARYRAEKRALDVLMRGDEPPSCECGGYDGKLAELHHRGARGCEREAQWNWDQELLLRGRACLPLPRPEASPFPLKLPDVLTMTHNGQTVTVRAGDVLTMKDGQLAVFPPVASASPPQNVAATLPENGVSASRWAEDADLLETTHDGLVNLLAAYGEAVRAECLTSVLTDVEDAVRRVADKWADEAEAEALIVGTSVAVSAVRAAGGVR